MFILIKINSVTLSESTKILADSLGKIDEQKHEDTLEKIIDELTKKNRKKLIF